MKVFKFADNKSLSSNLPEVQKQAEYAKAKRGKWYHWERVYLIKASGEDKYGFVSLNFFERLARNICHIKGIKKAFKGEKIVVIDSKTQKIHDVSKILNPSLRIHNPRLFNIPAEINAIKEEKNLETKRASFQQIYHLLRTEALAGRLEKKDHFLLYSLLEAFASQTLYAQTFNEDREAGFRKSAKVMEFSLELQLKGTIDWTKFETLDAIPNHSFTDWRPSSILHSAKKNGNSETVKEALIRLAYSYQNIAARNQPTQENIKLHSSLNEVTEQFLKNDPKGAAEFAYNRRPFLFALKNPQDILGKINCYKELLPLFKNCLSPFEYKRKEAQIFNMLGLTLTRNNMEPDLALQYFSKAYELNSELVNEAPSEEVPTQKFLRANVLSSLIAAHCNAKQLVAAKPHVAALKSYMEELDQLNNNHSYRAGYEKAITIYEEAVKSIQPSPNISSTTLQKIFDALENPITFEGPDLQHYIAWRGEPTESPIQGISILNIQLKANYDSDHQNKIGIGITLGGSISSITLDNKMTFDISIPDDQKAWVQSLCRALGF